jgi:hypothetical protein
MRFKLSVSGSTQVNASVIGIIYTATRLDATETAASSLFTNVAVLSRVSRTAEEQETSGQPVWVKLERSRSAAAAVKIQGEQAVIGSP